MSKTRSFVALVAVLVGGSGLARAAGTVVVLTEPAVAQYRDALAGAKEVLGDPTVVDTRDPGAAGQLKQIDPAVVVAIGQKSVSAARATLPATPIIFALVLGPDAQPSRSVTGVRLEIPAASQLAQLKALAPAAKRVGMVYNPKVSAGFADEAQHAAGANGLTLVTRPISEAKEARGALADIAGSIDALLLVADPRLYTPEMFDWILGFTLERKIALFGFLDVFTQRGALASLAPDYKEMGKRAGQLANEVAQKPAGARLPVPSPVSSPGAFTVNLKTAKQLGLDVPQSVLGKARQVFR
jgi:putative ABC transport system substrate-binding protein